MKIVPFDPNWVAWGASNGTLLGVYSGGSNTAFGGDVTGDQGDLSVVGMRRQVSLASNIGGTTIGDVLTIIQTSPRLAMFATPSNSGALSFGSNAMSVGATNQAGTTGTYIGADHRHLGLHSITSSTSNTLQRPTVNLRAGANVALTATDSDGDGTFDTVTISSTAAGGGTPDNSGLINEKDIQPISDYVSAYDASAGASRGFPVASLMGGRQGFALFEECFRNGTVSMTYAGSVVETINGTGVFAITDAPSANHPGVVNLATGGGSTGRATLAQANGLSNIVLNGGKLRFGAWVRVNALGSATQRYELLFGLSDTSLGSTTVDGVFFMYQDNNSSGNWEGRTSSNSVASTLNTGQAVDTNWHLLEFEVNAAATSVEFFIDRVSMGTLSTNIPTGSTRGTRLVPASIGKSVGTTSRDMDLDAYYLTMEFTTAR